MNTSKTTRRRRQWQINRRIAAEQIGPACPTGIVPPPEEELAVVTREWIDMFERTQLALRLSPVLRERYGG